MKDIEKAMQCEKIYLNYRSVNTDTSFIGMLAKCGYDTIDSYHEDKNAKLLKDVGASVKHLNTDQSDAVAFDAIAKQSPMLIIDTIPRLTAWVGSQDPIDEDKAKSLGVSVRKLPYDGGIIIGGTEDLALVFITPSGMIQRDYIQRRLVDYLENASLVNNDIMIDGKKVAGCAYHFENQMDSLIIQISFSDHSEFIKELCVLNPKKPAGYVTRKTQADLTSEVISWVQ